LNNESLPHSPEFIRGDKAGIINFKINKGIIKIIKYNNSMEIKLAYVQCNRCNHKWVARKTVIAVCPKCHSPYWNRERVRKGYDSKNIKT